MRHEIKRMPLRCHWLQFTTVRCGIQWHGPVDSVGTDR